MIKKAKVILEILFILALLFSCNGNSKSTEQKTQTEEDDKASNILKDENVFDTLAIAYGDINFDSFSDYVMVLKKRNEDSFIDTNSKRLLQIFFGNNDNSYKLFQTSEDVVMTKIMGGGSTPEPFSSMKIENGLLTIVHHGGMGSYHWKKSISFKYSKRDKKLLLIQTRFEEEKYSDNPSEVLNRTTIKTNKDFGKVPLENFNIFKDRN